ncbi:MAG: S9 family peptidase, partial [Archangium sp.]
MHKLLVVACLVAAPVFAQDGGVALIPRNLLFGNPERTRPNVSPDGKSLAWLAPDDRNVLQVWVDGAIVTADKKRGIRNYGWSEDSKSILYGQDADGDENFHVFQVELATKNVRDLTPWQGVRAGMLATSPKQPNVLLVTANVRDRRFHDVYRVQLDTGAATLDTQNPGDVNGWTVDAQFNVRGATATTKEGGTEIRIRESVKAPWKPLITVGLEENVELVDFTEDGKGVVLSTSINSDTQRLVEKNLKSGAERVLLTSEKSDVSDTIGYPTKRGVRAAAIDVNGRNVWVATEPSMKSELEAIDAAIAGDFWVVSMDAADTRWILVETRDNGPQRFWNWDRKA